MSQWHREHPDYDQSDYEGPPEPGSDDYLAGIDYLRKRAKEEGEPFPPDAGARRASRDVAIGGRPGPDSDTLSYTTCPGCGSTVDNPGQLCARCEGEGD